MTRVEAIEVIKDLIDTYVVCHGEEDMVAVSLDNIDVEALDMAISALSENKGEWIPVSERLPKAYQKVLVTYEEIHWANEPTTYGVELISFGGVADFIAWQPLPEPYKAESEE